MENRKKTQNVRRQHIGVLAGELPSVVIAV